MRSINLSFHAYRTMPETKVISFRLDERHFATLHERAAAVHQSGGEFARQLVLEGLVGLQVTSTLEQASKDAAADLSILRQAMRELRVDHKTGLRALLVTVAKIPPADVDAWLEANLGGSDA